MDLPPDMIAEIMRHLNHNDIDKLCRSNQQLNNLCEMQLWKRAYEERYPKMYKVSYRIIQETVDRFLDSFCEITTGRTKYRLCKQIPTVANGRILHCITIDKNPVGSYDVVFQNFDCIDKIDHKIYKIHNVYKYYQGTPSEFRITGAELPKLLFELKRWYSDNDVDLRLNHHEQLILDSMGYIHIQ